MNRKTKAALVSFAALAVVAAGCGGGKKSSAVSASQKASAALQSQIYQDKNNVEFKNYNDRQKLADDPSTILWCTFYPPTVGQQPFTYPIAGKLTSSNKRPYSTTAYIDAGNYAWYPKDVPGPDHMFGSSSEYRYGFDPTRTQYVDFTALPSFCTNKPTTYQANKTNIVVTTDATLNGIDKAAQAALKAGDAKKAMAILSQAGSK